jgi:CheY-like chemotaxis protein
VDNRLGLKLADAVRGGQFEPRIPRDAPILFFSARTNAEITREALAKKPSAYLTKPAFLDDVQYYIGRLSASSEQ